MTTINGTPQRLYLMQLARASVSRAGRMMDLVLVCYLVKTSDGKNILIDSGLPADFQRPEGALSTRDEKNVIEQLAELDLRPEDIDILICTHFDVDHAGYHDAFTNAELVVQREHYELARSGYPRFAAARAHWDHPALRYRMVDGDTDLLPGRLTLLETSGHTTGHQSVLVRLPQTGPVLLTIDSVPVQRAFTADRQIGPMDENEEQLRASTQKLLNLVEREEVGLVVFGHDGAQWQTLKKAPEYYE